MRIIINLTENEINKIHIESDKIIKLLIESGIQPEKKLKSILSYHFLSAKVEDIIASKGLHVEDEIGTILL